MVIFFVGDCGLTKCYRVFFRGENGFYEQVSILKRRELLTGFVQKDLSLAKHHPARLVLNLETFLNFIVAL